MCLKAVAILHIPMTVTSHDMVDTTTCVGVSLPTSM